MQTRVLGGEAGRRGFFGGSHGKARTRGLIAVAIVGAVLTIALGGVGLVVTVLVAAAVYLATMRTHRGSVLGRWQARRRWKERLRTGTVDFAPVATRPADFEPAGGSGKRPAAAGPAWAAYRDWPDGAEGMHWLARDPGEPGVLWHAPTGEPAYLSVAFRVDGQIRGVESDRFLDAAMTAIGDLLARYGSSSALPNRVQFLTRVLPVDSTVHEDWVSGELDPHAAEELVASYDEVVRLVSGSGLMQRHYVVIR